MILTIYQNHRRWTAKELQSRIELDTLSHRHIVIGCSMHEEQWSMNFVCIVERTLIYEEMFVGPRILVRHGNLAVAVSPIAFAPIAGMVADAGMRNGCGKEIGLGLKILSHKATVAGADTTYLLAVYETMLIAESLGAGDNILSHSLAGSIHVTGRELLTETGGSAWVHDQNHITHRCIDMMRITALEHTGGRTATTIVVHHHRILLGSIEMRWQIVTAAKSVATGLHEVPSLALAQLDVFQQAGTKIIYEQRLLCLGAHLVESVSIGCTLS